MKKTSNYTCLILAFVLLQATNFQAQQLVAIDNQWNIVVPPSFTPQTTSYSVRIGADTTLDNKLYNKVYYSNEASNTDWQFGYSYLRQTSDKKVYYKQGDGTEVLLYDFALELFDLFSIDGICTLMVYDIDTVQLKNGELRKRLTLGREDNPDWGMEQWIDGIGSTFGVISHFGFCGTDYGEGLLCFYADNELRYPTAPFSCFVTGIEELKSTSKFKIYPNPVQTTLNIEGELAVLSTYKIYDLLGKTVGAGGIKGIQDQIELSGLQSGYYMLVLSGKDGSHYAQKIIKM